jgi:hypothetical protein
MTKQNQKLIANLSPQPIEVARLYLRDTDEITDEFQEFNKKINGDCIIECCPEFENAGIDYINIIAYREETSVEFETRKLELIKQILIDEKTKIEQAKQVKIKREARELAEFNRLKKKFNK